MRRIIHIQPALPAFRWDFFERLHAVFVEAFELRYAGEAAGVSAGSITFPAVCTGPSRKLPLGFVWQPGVFGTAVTRDDIVVLSGNPRYLSTLLLGAKARLRGARVVWWGHYWSSSSKNWRMVLRMALMRLAHGVVFYTDDEVSEYRAGLGRYDKRPVVGLNNGINTAPIRDLRAPYVAKTRGREILFVGRQTAKAKLSLLIQALATPALSDVRLHVVGEGDESERSRAVAETSGVADRVTWHGVSTDESVIAPIANRCRVFVYPGEVGLSLIHGMAYGLPCVVHSDRWQHMPEIAAFEVGQTGRMFAPNDVSDLASVIAGLLSDENALDEMSEYCRQVTDNGFNTQDMAARFVTFVERLAR